MSFGYGVGIYGTSIYGLGAAFSVDSAYAISERQVRVVFTAEPLFTSRIRTGDALNPTSWSVTNPSTTFTVMSITQHAATTYDILVLEKFADHHITHTVSVPMLHSGSGGLISSPFSATFAGVVSKISQQEQQPMAALDLKNDAQGALIVQAGGDFKNDTGFELLQKKIMRRLTTQKGAFYHLPTYGLGLFGKIKLPLTSAGLVSLQREIEREILQEPEVFSASVKMRLDSKAGILSISYGAKTRLDQPIQGSFTVSLKE